MAASAPLSGRATPVSGEHEPSSADTAESDVTDAPAGRFSEDDYRLIYHRDQLPVDGAAASASVGPRFGRKETELSSSQRQLLHRFRSIALDCEFVERVRQSLPRLPVVGNLRAGAWYVKETDYRARFKSVDGHGASWTFQPTRANIDFAKLAIENHGAILVDATRTGKSCPDSLNRTVPLWCAVMNQALWNVPLEDNVVVLPPWLAEFKGDANRFSQQRIMEWAKIVQALIESSGAHAILQATSKRFRPFFVLNDQAAYGFSPFDASMLSEEFLKGDIPIVCVSASAAVSSHDHREHYSFAYVPGAGDDEENWCMGLMPSLFHANMQQLLKCTDSDQAEAEVKRIVAAAAAVAAADKTSQSLSPHASSRLLTLGRFRISWDSSTDSGLHANVDLNWLKSAHKNSSAKSDWHTIAFPLIRSAVDAQPASVIVGISAGDEATALTAALFVACRHFGPGLSKEASTPRLRLDKASMKSVLADVCARLPGASALDRRLAKLVFAEFAD